MNGSMIFSNLTMVSMGIPHQLNPEIIFHNFLHPHFSGSKTSPTIMMLLRIEMFPLAVEHL
jgi:hypothetical protein